MERKKGKIMEIFDRVPPLLLTAVSVAAILWLTLSPHPLGDVHPPVFPGADKIGHTLMFGGLAAIAVVDMHRIGRGDRTKKILPALIIVSCILFGVLIEYLQEWMHLGRSFEYADIVADATGCIIGGLIGMKLRGSL